jgi:hypothetical protein
MEKYPPEAVNYRTGDPISNCGHCMFFFGAGRRGCARVQGQISSYMMCDVYRAEPNPTGQKYSLSDQAITRAG